MAQRSNRQQLLDGAVECLERQGYARTTARDIARASGANLASIGYHFGSKEELLNEALIALFKRRNWTVASKADRSAAGSTADRLRSYFRAGARVLRAPRPLLGGFVEAIAQASHADELRTQLADHYRDARRAVGTTALGLAGAGADAPDAPAPDEADVVGTVVLALFDGLAIQAILDPRSVPSGDELLGALATLARPLVVAA